MHNKKDFLQKWGNELQRYCEEYNLNFELIKTLGASYNLEEGYLNFDKPWDEESEELARLELEGKLPKQRVKKVLLCEFTDDKITFTQTEHTQKYIALNKFSL